MRRIDPNDDPDAEPLSVPALLTGARADRRQHLLLPALGIQEFKRELERYLRCQFEAGKIHSVKFAESHRDNLVQLADIVLTNASLPRALWGSMIHEWEERAVLMDNREAIAAELRYRETTPAMSGRLSLRAR